VSLRPSDSAGGFLETPDGGSDPVPIEDHGELGDGSLIQKERAFLLDLQTQALQLKRKGVSAEEAGKTVTETLKSKYPDWPNLRGVPNVVQRVYAESN